MKKYLSKGFTLVELLIVIALLGVIATIVIAAINPIEQANRARDSQFKSDSSQLLSAVERYYVANQYYPWVTNGVASNDTAYGFKNAADGQLGICSYIVGTGVTDCNSDGILITALELKSGFRTRNFISNSAQNKAELRLFVGKAASTAGTSSPYACYIPMSKSNRDSACTAAGVYTVSTTTGARTKATCVAGADWSTHAAGDASGNPTVNTWLVCVPD